MQYLSTQGLYKGNMPAEYLYLSYSAVEFWAYKELEQIIEKVDAKRTLPHTLKTFGCGMIAGCAATAATYPFDLLRTRFAVQAPQKVSYIMLSAKYFWSHFIYTNLKQNTSVTRAMADIYNMEGAAGFYRGLWPAIIQIMPYMGLLFSSYDIFAKGFKNLRVSVYRHASCVVAMTTNMLLFTGSANTICKLQADTWHDKWSTIGIL